MAHEYKLTIKMGGAAEGVTLSGSFRDEDWQRLEDFEQYAGELLRTKFVQDGMPGRLKMDWRQGGPLEVTAELPPWDDVMVYLHRLRPLLLQSEDTEFGRVCNTLTRELADPGIRSLVGALREIYSGKRVRSGWTVRVNEVVLNSDGTLSKWLQGYEYHRDRDKRAFIEGLQTMLPLDASKVIFLQLLAEKTIAIYNLAGLVRVVLGKQKSIGPAPGPALDDERA